MNIIDRVLLWFCDKQINRISKKAGTKVNVKIYNGSMKDGAKIGLRHHRFYSLNPQAN